MKQYKVVNEECIQLVDGPFLGVTYQYGGVRFNEPSPDNLDDSLTISFDYSILQGDIPPDKKDEFHTQIGDILVEILESQLSRNEVVYTGGI